MVRYYAFATAIVIVAISLLLALPHASRREPAGSHYTSGRATPGVGGDDPDVRPSESVGGVAPWALSAVPECFRQRASYRGGAAFARAHLPAGARLVPAGSRLRVADCTLDVAAASAELIRGDSRFVVPPTARFYVSGRALVLDQSDGPREEVRVYGLRGGASPAFVTRGG